MPDARARAAAEEILAPLRGERLEHEVYTVLVRRVADAVAQAVQQERNEGQVRLANAVSTHGPSWAEADANVENAVRAACAQAVKERDDEKTLREKAIARLDEVLTEKEQQAEEIAALQGSLKATNTVNAESERRLHEEIARLK